jgi:RHS repeat-associated protein
MTTFFLDDGDNEIAEYDGSGNLLNRYIPGPNINDPIAMVTANAHTYFHVDKLGSVVAMSGANGNLAQGPFNYDAYGKCLVSGSTCPTGEPYRFTGQRLDPETGLYYDRARYYSTALGRFLQTDPVEYKDDLDLYTYVGDDPTDKIDPTGMFFVGDDAAEAAVGVVVLGSAVAMYAAGECAATQCVSKAFNSTVDYINGVINRNDQGDQQSGRRPPPNPDGPKGAPDHQSDVQGPGRQEAQGLADKKPGSTVETERKIRKTPNGQPINRKPDNQVVDENGVTTDVVESERHPNAKRVKQKIEDYKRCGINCIIRPLPPRN